MHAALGAEIIHQHPAADGAAIGDTSHRDFRRLAATLLKALTIARNLNERRPVNFTTCDLDMQRHYRPRMNVVIRPTNAGGKGYEITGHHEIMIPMLVWAVVNGLDAEAAG